MYIYIILLQHVELTMTHNLTIHFFVLTTIEIELDEFLL